jgi:arylsulfatase B
MDVSDWVPTLGGLAGIDFSNESLDGIDQWKMINEGGKSLRSEIVNIDNVYNYSAIIKGDFKWVKGTLDNRTDGWISNKSVLQTPYIYPLKVVTSMTNLAISSATLPHLTLQKVRNLQQYVQISCKGLGIPCLPGRGPCLFNIIEDPCEENNLALLQPETLNEMTDFYNGWLSKVVPSNRKQADNASDPANFGGVWTWWQPDSVF